MIDSIHQTLRARDYDEMSVGSGVIMLRSGF